VQEAGHVAQWRALVAAIAERTQHLAFKVDDDEVLAGREQTSQSKVAVRAQTLRGELAIHDRSQLPYEIRFALDHLLSDGSSIIREIRHPLAQQLEHSMNPRTDGLIQRALIQHGERFGRELRIIRDR